jgi:hypothetical protein
MENMFVRDFVFFVRDAIFARGGMRGLMYWVMRGLGEFGVVMRGAA